jgi:uncharacterized protein YdhG (YjbR/CyaY superfamily)
MTDERAIDDFLDTCDPETRAAFARIVEAAQAIVPEAVQGQTYAMPALLHRKKGVVALNEGKSFLSVYPCSGWVVEQVADRLPNHSLSKGTIRFTVDNPIPDDVLKSLIELRRNEIENGRPQ